MVLINAYFSLLSYVWRISLRVNTSTYFCYFFPGIAGVPILHLISTPFPKVWHKASDNARAIDYARTENVSKVLRAFVAEYLNLISL